MSTRLSDGAPMTLGPSHAHVDGFDLNAGFITRASQRDRRERLCRYALRPPLAQERLAGLTPRLRVNLIQAVPGQV